MVCASVIFYDKCDNKMSAIIGQLVACPNIQERLNTQFTDFVPTDTMDAIGVLLFLMSPLNTSGMLQRQIAPGNAKQRKVELTYDQRLLDADIESTSIQSCVGGDEFGDCVTEYEIDPDVGVSHKWSLTNASLRKRCMDDEAWVARSIQKVMDGMERSMDIDVIADIALNFGNFADTSFDHFNSAASAWAGGTGPSIVQSRKNVAGSNFDFDPRLLSQVKAEFQHLNYQGAPIVFGDNLLDAYVTELDAACCADSGLNLAELATQKPMIYMRDQNVENGIGTTEFIATVPGAIQILTYLEFEGPLNVMNDDTYKQGVLVNPRSGVAFDYLTKFDCGKWNFQLKKAFKTVFLPADLYQVSDNLEGVNWVQNFVVTN